MDVNSNSSIDEWRRSVDKTLGYYKNKVKTLKSNNKTKSKKNRTLWQREKRLLNNKIKTLQDTNEELKEQNYLFRDQLRSLRIKLKASQHRDHRAVDAGKETDTQNEQETDTDCFMDSDCSDGGALGNQLNIHKIFDFDSKLRKSSSMSSEVHVEQNEIAGVTAKHSQRLQKWAKHTQLLLDGCEAIKSASILHRYSEYKQIMAEQESKMEDISRFVSDLIAQKRRIKSFTDKYEKVLPLKHKQYREAFLHCDKVRDIRKKSYDALLEAVDRLNDAIDDENAMNEKQYRKHDEYHALNDELKTFSAQTTLCSQLIRDYQRFDALNDEKILSLQQSFEAKWADFQRRWFEWDSAGIADWFRYLLAENQLVLSSVAVLDRVQTQLTECAISGSWFESVSKNELKAIGFAVLNDRQQIYEKIRALVRAHPHCQFDGETHGEGQRFGSSADSAHSDKVQIPQLFLCPITKQIMREPVQIFDDYSYEKAAIVAYLRKHRRSPMTDEKCEGDDELVLLPNRKLLQKIQTFLCVNPQFAGRVHTETTVTRR